MKTALLLCALVLEWCAAPASAHRLDEYLQATIVSIEPEQIRVQINLNPGVAVAGEVLAQIDRDHDDTISEAEGAAYAATLQRDLTVTLDGRPLALKLTASEFPETSELRAGIGIMQLEFTAALASLAPGVHKLALDNHHLRGISIYLLNAALPKKATIQITQQLRNENQSTGEIVFGYHSESTTTD